VWHNLLPYAVFVGSPRESMNPRGQDGQSANDRTIVRVLPSYESGHCRRFICSCNTPEIAEENKVLGDSRIADRQASQGSFRLDFMRASLLGSGKPSLKFWHKFTEIHSLNRGV
jgi:hypothetical protein